MYYTTTRNGTQEKIRNLTKKISIINALKKFKVKQLSNSRAENKSYKDIAIADSDEFFIIGKILK